MSLTTAKLTQARNRLVATLPNSCAIKRPTRTYNDSGGWTDAPSTVATVACRVAPLTQTELVQGGHLAEDADGVLTVPYDTDLRGSDTVTLGGIDYQVSGIPILRSEPLVQRAYVRRMS